MIASSLRWALASLCGLAVGCMCESQDEPCEGWAKIGDTYTVELERHVDFGYFDATTYTGHADRTCGSDFDLRVGSVIKIEAAGKLAQQSRGACGPNCYAIRGQAMVPSVVLESEDRSGIRTIGGNRFRQNSRATIDGKCHGTYQIGVEKVDPYYVPATPEEGLSTDFVLYRGFKADPDSLTACAAMGSRIQDKDQAGICSDTWTVRVRDSSGRSLSQAFDVPAAKPPEDASTVGTDDGGDMSTPDGDGGGADGVGNDSGA